MEEKKHGEKFRWSTRFVLNAIREMIVNGIVMQRVYSRASIFGRSSDHGSFIPILNSPRAKSDFQSRIQGKRRLIDHRKRSFTLFFISPSLSLSLSRERLLPRRPEINRSWRRRKSPTFRFTVFERRKKGGREERRDPRAQSIYETRPPIGFI